jgi:integrase
VTVQQRGDRWRVRVRRGKDSETDKWTWWSETWPTEAEAWEAGRRLLAKRDAEEAAHVAPTRQTLGDYLPAWLERKRAEGRKPKTLYDYERVARVLIIPALGKTPLRDLSPAMIQAWQDKLAPAPGTPGAAQASLAYRCLRSALSDAARLRLLPDNPAKSARPALRTPRKRDGFTLAEARAILAAAEGEGLAPLFAFVLYTGLRLGEALGLRWADVDTEAARVTVRHNRVLVGSRMVEGSPKRERSARTMALLGGAVEALRRQKALQAEARLAAGEVWRDEDRVFATRDGGGLNASNVDRAFRRIRERASVRGLPPHSLRHATASILLAAGVPPAVAAKMMGHSVAMFCETYADLLVEATHDAARQADEWLARQGSAAPPAAPKPAAEGARRRRR